MVAFNKKAARTLDSWQPGPRTASPDVGWIKLSTEAQMPHEGDSMTETTSATLRHAGGELELPRIQVVEGNEGYDVSKLLKQTGAVAYDPALMNTAAPTSAIAH